MDPSRGSEVYAHPRQPCFTPDSENYSYYEGSGNDRCARDQDCVISGCYDSTCAAEVIQVNDSEFCRQRMLSQSIRLGSCGCLNRECRWYFENDYDRLCDTDDDCKNLGRPPSASATKSLWTCVLGQCRF